MAEWTRTRLRGHGTWSHLASETSRRRRESDPLLDLLYCLQSNLRTCGCGFCGRAMRPALFRRSRKAMSRRLAGDVGQESRQRNSPTKRAGWTWHSYHSYFLNAIVLCGMLAFGIPCLSCRSTGAFEKELSVAVSATWPFGGELYVQHLGQRDHAMTRPLRKDTLSVAPVGQDNQVGACVTKGDMAGNRLPQDIFFPPFLGPPGRTKQVA